MSPAAPATRKLQPPKKAPPPDSSFTRQDRDDVDPPGISTPISTEPPLLSSFSSAEARVADQGDSAEAAPRVSSARPRAAPCRARRPAAPPRTSVPGPGHTRSPGAAAARSASRSAACSAAAARLAARRLAIRRTRLVITATSSTSSTRPTRISTTIMTMSQAPRDPASSACAVAPAGAPAVTVKDARAVCSEAAPVRVMTCVPGRRSAGIGSEPAISPEAPDW